MTQTSAKTTLEYRDLFVDLNYNFAFNEVLQSIEVNGEPLQNRFSEIFCRARDRAGITNENILSHEIEYAARENSYHPVKKWLNTLPYDGGHYIDKLCQYFRADKYFCSWLNRWMIAAIGRAVKGSQCPVLVLDGPQGIGKSLFVKWLASPTAGYFTEGPIQPDSKDCRIRAAEKWIWEVAEFGSTTRKADIEALKGFLTQSEVTERQPYARQDVKRPMLACFVGTINNGKAGFLFDTTGSRRFIVTHVDGIDWEGYQDDPDLSPDKLWAEAYAAYLIGDSVGLTPAEQAASEANNQLYQAADSLQFYLEAEFEIKPGSQDFISTRDILNTLVDSGYKTGNSNAAAQKLREILAASGLQTGRKNGERGYFGLKNRH